MFLRPATTLSTPAFRSAGCSARQLGASRLYSTGSQPKNSNTPLYLTLGGIAGIGAWYGLGGFDGKSKFGQVKADGGAALDGNEFRGFKLREVKPYNHDSSVYEFELPKDKTAGLSVCSAILVRGAEDVLDDKGKPVMRPYTPINTVDTPGKINLLIKHYPGGKMTQHLKSLKPGDELKIKGPLPKFPYKANEFEHITCIAGGSGITPMWQLIQEISRNPSDKTKVTLLYSNKTEEDILLRERFDELAKKDDRFQIVYGLDNPPAKWNGGFSGFITPDVVKKYVDGPESSKFKIFVCGPPPQMKAVSGMKNSATDQGQLTGILADLGYKAEQVYKF